MAEMRAHPRNRNKPIAVAMPQAASAPNSAHSKNTATRVKDGVGAWDRNKNEVSSINNANRRQSADPRMLITAAAVTPAER